MLMSSWLILLTKQPHRASLPPRAQEEGYCVFDNRDKLRLAGAYCGLHLSDLRPIAQNLSLTWRMQYR